MKQIIFRVFPFVLPTLCILVFIKGIAGSSTPFVGISLLVLGFVYSIIDIILLKKSVVTSILSIYYIAIIFISGLVLFILMISSGV